jgi:hypothetical protein
MKLLAQMVIGQPSRFYVPVARMQLRFLNDLDANESYWSE